ncbi:hypothetical protein [Pelagibius sp. Alg239-R121]|uniref:hypothetical protein n=1 Tax=Pelagibius sp. Alg239-R121 TaxID=2993448 RepID=UPI0024A70587|nr:hypothetical protein [Pelagibius sp. Alg239-R121]
MAAIGLECAPTDGSLMNQNAASSVIDLSEIATDRRRDTISGRETGRATRERLGVSEQITGSDQVEIRIPEHVRVITPSFFVGLLASDISLLESIDDAKEVFTLTNASDTTQLNFDHAVSTILGRGSPFDSIQSRQKKFSFLSSWKTKK